MEGRNHGLGRASQRCGSGACLAGGTQVSISRLCDSVTVTPRMHSMGAIKEAFGGGAYRGREGGNRGVDE